MTKHVGKPSNVVPFVAVPQPGDTATYFRLHAMRDAAAALVKSVDRYLNTPALPECAGYREARMQLVEDELADLRKVLADG